MTEATADPRLPLKRRRVIYKRDYARQIEEVNKASKLAYTLESVEQLEAVRLSMIKTKSDLDAMYLEWMGMINEKDEDDAKLLEELLKERDNFLLNLDRAIGNCVAFRKRFEGGVKRDSLNASTTSAAALEAPGARLPPINVPTFDGDLRKFLDFKALFENLVHQDETVVPVRKMHYLKESLVGEAARTLSNLSVSNEGYKEAWSRVLAKYDNKRIIIHTHFNDLFSAERIRNETQLRALLDQIDVALRGLRTCGEATERWSSILSYMLYVRLDNRTKADFDNSVTNNAAYYDFKSIWKFCENRANNVEARKVEETVQSKSLSAVSNEPRRAFFMSRITCVVCQEQHLLIDCPSFMAKGPAERLKAIQTNKLCVNCFSRTHLGPACPSPKTCKICLQRHHYLLHLGDIPTAPHASVSNVASLASSGSEGRTTTKTRAVVVLPSAKVMFTCGRSGGEARILLDTCSQPTLISDTLVKRFKLRTFPNDSSKPIRGVGFQSVGANRSCRLTLVSRVSGFKMEIEADVISGDAIPYVLHSLEWESDAYNHVKQYTLADTAFYAKRPIVTHVDLILGAQYVERCLINESVAVHDMILRSTQFGWTLNGEFSGCEQVTQSSLCCFATTNSIERQVMEFLGSEKKEKTNSQEMASFCEQYFTDTTVRDDSGKFVVRLPFIHDPNLLGDNKNRAVAILKHSQARAYELRENYVAFMEEYEQLGHMSCVNDSKSSYFIPHHAVLKPDSTTTRTRVVFNASAPSDSGFSLNDLLAIGPQLQPELFDAIIRFRSYPVGVTGDIAKMYRCVMVHPEDRKFQQILWRPTPTEAIKVYELNTVTYGTGPASFLATRCLQMLADEIKASNPAAGDVIANQFYMDDLLMGGNTPQEVEAVRAIVHETLARAGMELRKYQSNSSELMQCIPEPLWLKRGQASSNDSNSTILGVGWNLRGDTIHVRVEKSAIIEVEHITKRQMLAEIAKVFDPMGLIAPFTIKAKMLIKEAWNEKITWDETVSPQLSKRVREYLSEIVVLSSFSIDRTYGAVNWKQSHIFGFCCASKEAYAVALYVKSGDITRLICAKTRIAPSKATTIERLQLQSAVLLSELTHRISVTLHAETARVTLCCESSDVLAWIASSSSHWTKYVRNRTEKIQQNFVIEHWRRIEQNSNPARLAVSGMKAETLLVSEEWITGPIELRRSNNIGTKPSGTTTLEREGSVKTASCLIGTCGGADRSIIDRCNSYTRLLAIIGRVISFVRRWRENRPSQVKYDIDKLSLKSRARTAVVLIFQNEAFKNEIEALQRKAALPSQSKLKNLDPFLDEDGVLRVRGRLDNSELSFQRRCPIIVPKNCHFLTLYIRYLHETFCHANRSFVVSFILAEFWVCGGLKAKVKSVLNACVTCARYRAETFSQIMGQLPRDRVTLSRPFANVGLDFCGPFNCRCLGHRSVKFNKIYACIFVCMSTRAIHIEIVSNLTSTHFLMSLHRFVARRGLPCTLYSDCGTNFIGAHKYLDLASEEVQNDATTHLVRWIFNPPRSPHRGGIWESAVKSAKSHATRVIGNRPMDYEEYVTLFTRIESILNSRPICYRIAPEGDDNILTPSHFLMGSLPYVLPEPEESRLPLWRRYELIRSVIQSFWKSWRNDYLNMLQRKEKWNRSEPNIQVGQLVLLKTEAAPCTWPAAVVQEVFPGVDGMIRTVLIRVAGGSLLRRDIRNLVKLPIETVQE